MKKIAKYFFIILLLLMIGIVFVLIRNYIVVDKIIKNANIYSKLNNYEYEIHHIEPTEKTYKIYKKDNLILNISDENCIFVDEKENKTIIKNIKTNEIIENDQITYKNKLPLIFEGEINFIEKVKLSLTLKLDIEEVNGKKCYIMKNKENKMYVYKDNFMIAKNINKNSIIEYINWNFNNISDEIFYEYLDK